MTQNTLRAGIGVFLVAAHFGMILLLVLFYFLGGFTFNEMKTAVELIGPMFAAYGVVIVRWFLLRRHVDAPAVTVDNTYVFFALFLPLAFAGFVFGLIIAKAYNWIDNFEVFKDLLALGETAFAVYLGILVEALFKR